VLYNKVFTLLLVVLLFVALTSVAQGFSQSPVVTDNKGKDNTFSVSNNSEENEAVIVFRSNGNAGDCQVIVDTHPPGAIGDPADWVGSVISMDGLTGNAQPFSERWNGDQRNAANTEKVSDGTYLIQVRMDYKPNGRIDENDTTYETRDIWVNVDSTAATLTASALPFSPNGDGVKDTTAISYKLSENLLELELNIVPEFLNQPVIPLTKTGGVEHTATWDGKDFWGKILDDGVYNWELTGTDAGGNVGTDSFQIWIDTKPPIISSTSLVDGDFVNAAISSITASLNSAGGAAIDYSEVYLTLKTAPDAQLVDGTLEKDEASGLLTFALQKPLVATDDNGTYTIEVTASDEAGNSVQRTAKFVFDNQKPAIASVSTAEGVSLSLSDPNILLPAQTTLLIGVQDRGDSGIDFANPEIRLRSPSDQSINIEVTNNGVNTINAAYGPLQEAGVYTLEITSLFDKAANVLSNVTYQFKYHPAAPDLPKVLSITPTNGVLVTERITKVEATMQDFSGKGLDLNSSTITLRKGSSEISGIQTNNGISTISWELFDPLAEDGSDDGVYNITIAPVDNANNTGQVHQTSFTYDTQAPEIVSLNPINISGGASLIKEPFDVISAVFSDGNGTGVNFARDQEGTPTKIELRDADGNSVAGEIDDNKLDTLNFRLPPFPRDGSKDGKYTVAVSTTDKAGKVNSQEFTFIYDTQIPTVVSTQPAENDKIATLNQVKVTLQDETSGVDLANTEIRIWMPDSSSIVANKIHDGVGIITLDFNEPETDGTQDGVYTIEVIPVDKTGNRANSPTRIEFIYVTKFPEIVAVSVTGRALPQDNVIIKQLDTIEAEFVEYSGEGIDFKLSSIVLKDEEGNDIPGIPSDDSISKLTWQIESPLAHDGTQDGTYSVTVSVTDKVGNNHSQITHFVFDSQIPTIVSTNPADNSKVGALSQVVAKLADATSHIDLDNTQIRLLSPNGTPIGANQTHDGKDTITLKFDELKKDGSQDGTYTIEVTAQDVAGNVAGSPSRIEFVYSTVSPEVASISPAHLSFVKQVSKVEAVLIDRGGKGIDFDQSTIAVKDKDGKDVAGLPSQNDGDSRIWFEPSNPFPTDGTADGIYDVSLHVVDKVGSSGDYTYKFTYDSQPPRITSQTPADKAILNTNVVTIEISVTDAAPNLSVGGSGVDFGASTVELQGPAGTVNKQQTDDGVSNITCIPDKLPQTGEYTIEVTLVDRAGNSTIPLTSSFDYAIEPPRVLAVAPANKSNINVLEGIQATLEDNSGTGLDFSLTATNITLTGPNNAEIEGTVAAVSVPPNSEIMFTLTSQLATDGTEDGPYTITVTPVDNTGTTGIQKIYTFTYDTQTPDIQNVTNIDMTASVSIFNGEVGRIEAVLQDVGGTGVDFEKSTVHLKIAADGKIVEGEAGTDENNKIWWQLASTLPRGGGSDGLYTVSVTAFDKAGNKEEKDYSLLYDTVVPSVTSTMPADGTTVSETISEISVKLEDTGSGIDLTASDVQLVGPQGIVGANPGDNGVDTIILTFNALKTDGSDDGAYTINVTPVDKAGNALTSPVQFEFFYVTVMPEVSSTTPAELGYVTEISLVSATLVDHSGEGIDLETSTIRLIAPDGKEVEEGRRTIRTIPSIGSLLAHYPLTVQLTANIPSRWKPSIKRVLPAAIRANSIMIPISPPLRK